MSVPAVRIGELDRRVTIQRKVITQDATYGTELVSWAALVTVWANRQDALPSRSESVLMGLAVAKNQTRLRLRWRDDIDSSMRLVDIASSEVLQIVGGPAMLGRRKYLELQCEIYGFVEVWLWADGIEIDWADGSEMLMES